MDPEGYERDQRAKKEALDKLYNVIIDDHSKPKHYEEEPYEDDIDLPPTPVVPQEIKQPTLVKQSFYTNRKINTKDMVIFATIFGPPKTLKRE